MADSFEVETTTLEDVDALERALSTDTAGRLLNRLRHRNLLTENEVRLCERAVKRRNFLVHHFWYERARDFMTGDGKRAMPWEVDQARYLFLEVDEILTRTCLALGERYGMTSEAVRAYADATCPQGMTSIPSEDRVTYAEAREITGRSHGYLAKLAREGRLTREGGTPQDVRATWLSRSEVEALALREYHPGRTPAYWLTTAQAAKVLGVTSETVRNRLPTHRAGRRTLLVRRDDVMRAVLGRALLGPQSWAR